MLSLHRVEAPYVPYDLMHDSPYMGYNSLLLIGFFRDLPARRLSFGRRMRADMAAELIRRPFSGREPRCQELPDMTSVVVSGSESNAANFNQILSELRK